MRITRFVFFVITVLFPMIAQSALILDWRDSNPSFVNGYQYRLVFVTSNGTPATSTDIETYNTFVQNAVGSSGSADLQELTGTWKAWASTSTVSAKENVNVESGDTDTPFYLVDGSQLATSISDLLDGSLGANINADELGNSGIDDRVWTGSNEDGTTYNHPLGTDPPLWGWTGLANVSWSRVGLTDSSSTEHRLYAFSDVQTFNSSSGSSSVPEPSSAILLGISVTVGLIYYWRRQKPFIDMKD